MNKPAHTPGPWHITRYNDLQYSISNSEDGYDEQWIADDIDEANAHLIAAAPAMYEALKYVLDAYAPYADPGMPQELFIAVQKAKTALAQAEGR